MPLSKLDNECELVNDEKEFKSTILTIRRQVCHYLRSIHTGRHLSLHLRSCP